MRARLLALSVALAAAAPARAADPPAPAPAADAAAQADAQLDAARQQLLACQQEKSRLRRELADAQTTGARLRDIEVKNARLIQIGGELVAAYEKRYGRSSFKPFQLARRRMEEEAQAFGDRIYENGADVPPRPVPVSDTAAPAPAKNP